MKRNIENLKNNSVAAVMVSVKKEESKLLAIKNSLKELASKDEAYNTIKVLSTLEYRTVRVASNSNIKKTKEFLKENLNDLIEKLKANGLKVIAELVHSLCTEETIRYSLFGTITELFGDVADNNIQVITANKAFAAFLPHIFMTKYKGISPEIDVSKVEVQDVMVICRDILKELKLKINLPVSTNVAETVTLNNKLSATKNLVKELVEMAIDNHPVINWIDSIYSLYLLQEEAIKTAECWQKNMAEIDALNTQAKEEKPATEPVKQVEEVCKSGYSRIEETTVTRKYVSNTTGSSGSGGSSFSGSTSEYSTGEMILGGIVVAGAAYGAYRAGKWAYNKLTGKSADYGVSTFDLL